MFRTQQPSATQRRVVPAAALILEILAAHPVFAQGAISQGQPTAPASISVSSGLRVRTLGSVPADKASGTAIPLSISDALERGLKNNLGAIESDEKYRLARGQGLVAVKHLTKHLRRNGEKQAARLSQNETEEPQ